MILGNHAVIADTHGAIFLLAGAGWGVVDVVVVDVDSTTVVVGVSVMQSAGELTLTMPMSASGKTANTEVRRIDERIDAMMSTPNNSMKSAVTRSAKSLPVPGSSQTTLVFTGTFLTWTNECNEE